MLPQNLTTNEVKNAAGIEVEFVRGGLNKEGVQEFVKNNENPSSPLRLSIGHQEIGTGVSKRRRSVVRVVDTRNGTVDTSRKAPHIAYLVIDIPVGNIDDYSAAKDVLANLLSFCASTGADTAIKFDCTGNGAAALINGTY